MKKLEVVKMYLDAADKHFVEAVDTSVKMMWITIVIAICVKVALKLVNKKLGIDAVDDLIDSYMKEPE